MWLLKNGDQLIIQTFDRMLHRLNIIDNDEHEIVDKTNYLLFIMNNSGRKFVVNNKNAVLLDYDLLDRIMKGIRIDPIKF